VNEILKRRRCKSPSGGGGGVTGGYQEGSKYSSEGGKRPGAVSGNNRDAEALCLIRP